MKRTPSPATLFKKIYEERIAWHRTRNTVYLDDISDLINAIERFKSKSMFEKPPKLKYQIPSPEQLEHVELVFIPVFLSKLYLDTHYSILVSYCKRMGISYFIPEIHHSDSSINNGKRIYEQLKRRYKASKKKFILLGMSKGAVDGMVSIVHSPASIKFAEKNILSLISIGGSIGGSHLANALYNTVFKYIEKIPFIDSPTSRGVHSLTTETRKECNKHFSSKCPSSIKLYSLSFYNKDALKSILAPSNVYLSQFETHNDGFVLLKDSKIPNSIDLGSFAGDHSALIPFLHRHHLELFESCMIYLQLDGVIS